MFSVSWCNTEQTGLKMLYGTTRRNRNRVSRNHLDQSLSSSHKNRSWPCLGSGGLDSMSYLYIDSHQVSAESWAGERELWIIDNETSWGLRTDARRTITLYYQTQVSLSLAGLDSVPLSKIGICLLASLGIKEKIGTLLLASEMPVRIPPSRTVLHCIDFRMQGV